MQTVQKQQPESNKPARLGEQFVQAKLKIGKPGDKYEHEAERVADAVMRMPDSQLQMQAEEEEEELQMKPESPQIQLMCPRCQERAKQGKPLNCPECSKKLQMSRVIQKQDDNQGYASPDITNQLAASKGRGSSLNANIQQKMSQKMGADFSNVNIHTDSKAVQMSRQLGAKAFTYGRDIFFNQGQYNPGTSEGKHLLAHELTHVVQQQSEKRLSSRKIQRTPAAAAPVTAGAVLAWCLSGAAVSVVIDQIFQVVKWWSDDEVKQNWCRTLFTALFGCVFGMAAGAIRTMFFRKAAAFTIAELGLWIKQRLIAAGFTWLAAKWGVTIALLGCDESDEKI